MSWQFIIYLYHNIIYYINYIDQIDNLTSDWLMRVEIEIKKFDYQIGMQLTGHLLQKKEKNKLFNFRYLTYCAKTITVRKLSWNDNWLTVNCPQENCPQVYCPEVNCPLVNCPQANCSQVNCPQVDCPQVNCPQANCPQVNCPQVNCPSVNCPLVNCP